jgi:hypothetical protein
MGRYDYRRLIDNEERLNEGDNSLPLQTYSVLRETAGDLFTTLTYQLA